MSRDLYKILLSDFKLDAVADDHAKLSARADLSEFLVKTDRRLYLPMVAIRSATGDLLDRKRDDYPIRLGWRDNVLLRLKLKAPGYAPKAAQPLTLGSKQTATVKSSLSRLEEGVVAEYRFWMHHKRFEGPQRDALLKLSSTYLKSRKKMFMLEKIARAGEKTTRTERSTK